MTEHDMLLALITSQGKSIKSILNLMDILIAKVQVLEKTLEDSK